MLQICEQTKTRKVNCISGEDTFYKGILFLDLNYERFMVRRIKIRKIRNSKAAFRSTFSSCASYDSETLQYSLLNDFQFIIRVLVISCCNSKVDIYLVIPCVKVAGNHGRRVQSCDGVLWATTVYYFLVPSKLKRCCV